MKIDAEWAAKKARWMVEREIHLISTSAAPSSEPCRAMIEAYTVVSLLSEQQHDEFILLAGEATTKRRRALTAQRIDRILKEVQHDRTPCHLAH